MLIQRNNKSITAFFQPPETAKTTMLSDIQVKERKKKKKHFGLFVSH